MRTFLVGEIVTVNNPEALAAAKERGLQAFVHDVGRKPRFYDSGIYSLFALVPVTRGLDMQWFLGDYEGNELTPTGNMMSKEALMEYRKKVSEDHADRIDFVISHLGQVAKQNDVEMIPSKQLSEENRRHWQ